MKRWLGWSCLLVLLLFPASGIAGNLGVGGGLRYNLGIGSFRDVDFNRQYLSYVGSVKYQALPFLAGEFTLDYFPGSGAVDYIIRPSAVAILGNFINVGLGLTTPYHKARNGGSGWGDLKYQLQAGVQIPLTSLLWLNADAYYFVQKLHEIRNFNQDYITLGARVHLRF